MNPLSHKGNYKKLTPPSYKKVNHHRHVIETGKFL